MILRCINLSIWFVILICTRGNAQFGTLTAEAKLLRHLRQHKLYDERYFVLNNLTGGSAASIKLEKAWTLSALNRSDSAVVYYNSISFDSIQLYGFSDQYLVLLFISNHLELLHEKLSVVQYSDSITTLLDKGLGLMRLQKNADCKLPASIETGYVRYNSLLRKSTFIAGMLSIVIPGAGKVYYGQKRQGWNFFVANVVLGLQAYESYRKAGVQSARFITFGTAFSFFYIANIYGSVKGLIKARHDRKRQLHYEIANSFFNSPLQYPGTY